MKHDYPVGTVAEIEVSPHPDLAPSKFFARWDGEFWRDCKTDEGWLESVVGIAPVDATGEREERVTSATGGQKGRRLAELGTLCPKALLELAKVGGYGARKYARYNFLNGYDWSLSYDALQRHLLQFWAGDDKYDESGLYHLGHAAWHCLALLAFSIRGLGTDDRPSKQADSTSNSGART